MLAIDKNASAAQVPSPLIAKLKKNTLHLISGGVAGALSRTAVAPIERVIILQQTKNQKYLNLSISKMIAKMYSTEGIRSLFKGNGANCLKIAPFQSIEFFSFECYKNILYAAIPQHGADSAGKGFVKTFLLNTDTSILLISGALAGMTASTCVYPLDLIKTVLAFNTENGKLRIFSFLRDVYRTKGFFALYKGWGSTMIGIGPYASLKLTFFQLLRKMHASYFNADKAATSKNVTKDLVMGAVAGCMAVTVTYPTDLLRRRMQIRILEASTPASSESLFRTAKNLVQKEGFLALYKGLWATYCKVLPSTALVFAINEKLKKSFKIDN